MQNAKRRKMGIKEINEVNGDENEETAKNAYKEQCRNNWNENISRR